MAGKLNISHDMTKGSPTKHILLFTIPLLIGNIFQQLYSMVDTIIVGRYVSTGALAAVGVTGSISFLIIGFVQGYTSGFAVITAQRFGAEDVKGVRRSVATSLLLSGVLTVAVTAISVLAVRPMLQLINTPADIIEDAYMYIVIIVWGTAATVFYNLISSIIRAIGDSRTPLIFLIVASVINIVLDIVLIKYGEMGVAGAAVATVISQLVAGLLCLIYSVKKYPQYMRLHLEDFKTSWEFCKAHLNIGLPMGFQFSVTAIGVMVIQGALNVFGTNTIAAYTAAMKVQNLVTAVLSSLGVTMATYAAQNFGACEMHRIRKGVRSCSLIAVVVGILGTLIVLFFNEPFIRLFMTEPSQEIIHQAWVCLLVCGLFYFVLGLLFVYRNVLQGIGKSLVPFLAGVAELLMRILCAIMLSGWFGYAGVCASDPIAWIGATVPLGIAYFLVMKKLDPHHKKESLPIK